MSRRHLISNKKRRRGDFFDLINLLIINTTSVSLIIDNALKFVSNFQTLISKFNFLKLKFLNFILTSLLMSLQHEYQNTTKINKKILAFFYTERQVDYRIFRLTTHTNVNTDNRSHIEMHKIAKQS